MYGELAQWKRVRSACGKSRVRSPDSPGDYGVLTCFKVGCYVSSHNSYAEHSIAALLLIPS